MVHICKISLCQDTIQRRFLLFKLNRSTLYFKYMLNMITNRYIEEPTDPVLCQIFKNVSQGIIQQGTKFPGDCRCQKPIYINLEGLDIIFPLFKSQIQYFLLLSCSTRVETHLPLTLSFHCGICLSFLKYCWMLFLSPGSIHSESHY